MAFNPKVDLLTLNREPPPLRNRDGIRISFAMICSPVTYGVKLHDELKAKNRLHEYLLHRNRAILKRECLRLDFLDPIVAYRIGYLNDLTKQVKSSSSQPDPTTVATKLITHLSSNCETYNNDLNYRTSRIHSISEYQDKCGIRLSTVLNFNDHDAYNRKLIVRYEHAIQSLASSLLHGSPTHRYLLLHQDAPRCLLTLTDNDDDTRFFPVLTDRETALIQAHLLSFGVPQNEQTLDRKTTTDLCQRWPTHITITRHHDEDYFASDGSNPFDQFTILTPDSTSTSESQNPRAHDSTDSTDNPSLLGLDQHQAEQTKSDPCEFTHTNPQSTDTQSTLQLSQTSDKGKQRVTLDLRQQEFADTSQSLNEEEPDTPKVTNATLNLLETTLTTAAEYSRAVGTTVLFGDSLHTIRLTRARPQDSAPRTVTGEMVFIRISHTTPKILQPLDLFVTRFYETTNNVFNVYMTKEQKFRHLLTVIGTATKVKIEITIGPRKESMELDPITSKYWFTIVKN